MSSATNLRVSLLQLEIAWENPAENRARFSEKIKGLPATDLIVLPEMFTTGFSMNAQKLAEKPEGETLAWLRKMAIEKNAALTGSVITTKNDLFYNRLFFVFPNGDYKTYDKKHLFTFAEEHKTFTPGKEKLILEYRGWKICPLVCYDLRFPVWSRNVENYDLLLYVAHWPDPRIQAWDILLRARAVENISYTAGVNAAGNDGNGLHYSGHSAIYDPLGNQVSATDFEQEFSDTVSLNKSELDETRKKLAFLNDRDDFVLN